MVASARAPVAEKTAECPGCGGTGPAVAGPYRPVHNASSGCWARYRELSAYTLTLGDAEYLHQHVVDAFAAQHPGPPGRALMTTLALVGLCLALERGWTGREIQAVHRVLCADRRDWPTFRPPRNGHWMTVHEVMAAPPGEPRAKAIRIWMASVWAAWAHEHGAIEDFIQRRAGIPL